MHRPRPIAEPGQVVRLQPDSTFDNPLREIETVEQLGVHPRHDFGSIAANGVATEDNDEDVKMTELEMKQGQIGQWRVDILSPVEIEVMQTGEVASRFESANNVGRLTSDLPAAQRRIFVLDEDTPYFTVHNPRDEARDAAYVAFPGEYKLSYRTISREELGARTPVSVPVARQEVSTQSSGREATSVVDRYGDV